MTPNYSLTAWIIIHRGEWTVEDEPNILDALSTIGLSLAALSIVSIITIVNFYKPPKSPSQREIELKVKEKYDIERREKYDRFKREDAMDYYNKCDERLLFKRTVGAAEEKILEAECYEEFLKVYPYYEFDSLNYF